MVDTDSDSDSEGDCDTEGYSDSQLVVRAIDRRSESIFFRVQLNLSNRTIIPHEA